MTGTVPLARRNLLADRRRLAASVAGVGLAVMLILLLDGMWTGVRAQSRLYADRAGADLFVLQPGVSDLIAGESVLPASTVDTVAGTPGVTWATPVQSTYVILEFHAKKVATYLVGSVPGQAGGPWVVAEGRTVRTGGEIVVDSLLARRHGLDVGDRMAVMGQPFRIVGISRESSGFMGVGYVFVTHDAAARLLGAASTTSYVLVGTADPGGARQRLTAQGLNVLTKEQAGSNTQDFFTGVFGGPLRLMVAVAFAAGTLVIALTAYTAVAMIGLLITGAYILKAVGSVLHGPLNEAWAQHKLEINRREVLAIAPLMVLMLFIGVWPAWILRVIEPTVLRLFG